MKVVQVTKPGGIEVLEYIDVPIPKPGKGEVLVRNAYSGVNFIDTYFRSGLYPLARNPFVLGQEGAGTVEAVGEGVSTFKKGDRVAYKGPGSYAEYTVTPEGFTIHVPDNVSIEVAGGSLLGGLTVLTLVKEAYEVKKGDWILVHAAAGGTGLILGQVLKDIGAHAIGTVSTAAKGKLAREAGFEHVIESYDEKTVLDKIKELTNGEGVICVYDGVGKTTWQLSLDALSRKGHMISFGNASGPVPPFAPLVLSSKALSVCRANMNVYVKTSKEFDYYAGWVMDWLSKGLLKITISGVYDLKDAGQAHTALEGRKTTGKLVLKTS